jgi:hypothetical protein
VKAAETVVALETVVKVTTFACAVEPTAKISATAITFAIPLTLH